MKKKASEGKPKEGDLPLKELAALANQRVMEGWDIRIKFTCAYCLTRCTLQEINTIYEEGECFNCGEHTVIDMGGFMMAIAPESAEDTIRILQQLSK